MKGGRRSGRPRRSEAVRPDDRCVYCRERPPKATFESAEHVIPRAFGSFRGALTLTSGEVCDRCNQYFGDTIDRQFARDSIDGWVRYQVGIKTDRVEPPSRNAQLRFRVQDTVLAGAKVHQKLDGGELKSVPVAQVGFGKTVEGPFEWFLVDALPSKVEAAKFLSEGGGVIRTEGMVDPRPVIEKLRELGFQLEGEFFTAPTPTGARVEVIATHGPSFGRAVAKIALNYVASSFSPEMARSNCFNGVRKFIRRGKGMRNRRCWAAAGTRYIEAPHERGHVIGARTIFGRVLVEIGFAGSPFRWHVLVTASGGRLAVRLEDGSVRPLGAQGAHFYDLKTKEVVDLGPKGWRTAGSVRYLDLSKPAAE